MLSSEDCIKKETLKHQILDMVRERPGTSFVELSGLVGFSGEHELLIDAYNITLWVKVSQPAVEALHELVTTGRIEKFCGTRLSRWPR